MGNPPDYLSRLPVVRQPTMALLMFPPPSLTPSGFYLVEPDGLGGNRYKLLAEEQFEPRLIRNWLAAQNERAKRVSARLAEGGAVWKELEKGAVWDPQLDAALCSIVSSET
jgi:hypothetical protein